MLAVGGFVLGPVVDGVDVSLVKLEPGVVSQGQVPVNRGMKLLYPPCLKIAQMLNTITGDDFQDSLISINALQMYNG